MALRGSWRRAWAAEGGHSFSSVRSFLLGGNQAISTQGLLFILECTDGSRPYSSSRPLCARNVGATVGLIKRKKEPKLDNVVEREKKLNIVVRIKEMILKHPGGVMPLRDLSKMRRRLGFSANKRCIDLLSKFPAVFQVYGENNKKLLRLTPEAESQHLEDMEIKQQLEGPLVEKLRKLLMMSTGRRILVEKIGYIRRDLGLPEDFKLNLVNQYPQYFRIVDTEEGAALEITAWDPKLAVSAFPTEALKEVLRKHSDGLEGFRGVAYLSPETTSQGRWAAVQAEKHAVAVIHELLSLTLGKKILVDHLTHFRREFGFSQRVRALLIRHPKLFYVSQKGIRDSVFLREAYIGSELIEKDPQVLVKERLAGLVEGVKHAKKCHQRSADNTHRGEVDGGEDVDADEDDEDSGSDRDLKRELAEGFSVEYRQDHRGPVEEDGTKISRSPADLKGEVTRSSKWEPW